MNKAEIKKLDHSNYDDLLLALEHEECDEHCKQPCHITLELRESAHTMLERLSTESSNRQFIIDRAARLIGEGRDWEVANYLTAASSKQEKPDG